jgi:hypothetical protein
MVSPYTICIKCQHCLGSYCQSAHNNYNKRALVLTFDEGLKHMTLPPDDNGPDEINNLPGDDVDPMKWLESLAARQGANPEEFITSADMDVPEADPNAVIDEPGYVDYDPFGSSKREKPAREAHLEPAPEPAPPQQEPATVAPAAMSADDDVDPLAWLESLAKRQGADPQEFVTEANLEIAEVDR